MREFLFRGKHEKTGEWKEGSLIVWRDGTMSINPGRLILPRWGVDPDTVGQYTGLKDKNGKKIFEGDIVLKRTYNGKKKLPVTFDAGMFHCGWGGGSSTATHGYTLADSRIEIVGNIHDNPELLEGENK